MTSAVTDASLKEEAHAMMLGYTSKFKVPVMNSQQISDLLSHADEEIYLVDVRDEEERQVSMIPSAISKETFLSRKSQLSKSTRIVSYCTIGHRSGVFSTQLLEEGFDNVHNGEGIILWSHLQNSQLVTGPDNSTLPIECTHLVISGIKCPLTSNQFNLDISPW